MNIMTLLLSVLFLMGDSPDKVPLPSIEQEIDRKEATIGDRLRFKVEIFTEEDQEVIPPENQPLLGTFAVKDRDMRIITRKGLKKTVFEYTLVSYDVGKNRIPEITMIIKSGDELQKLNTLPLFVDIKSVSPGLTGEEDIKGLKPQISIRLPYWYYPLGLFSILAIVGVILLLINRRRKRIVLEKVEIKPPWEIALAELNQLAIQKCVTAEEIKKFYIELSFILREYYEAMYKFPALENTTTEIMDYLKRIKEFKPHLTKTHGLLTQSDYVKFAKHIPPSFENEKEIGLVRSIVETTMEEEEEDA
jgi:hypothetical protein